MTSQVATFAAGCFWGVEASFMKIHGVISTTVGYTGGCTENPTYEEVCTDRTGHAESVQVVFDPEKVSYDGLLDVFWSSHDPTTRNRQGPDEGTQYRSVIFYHDEEQRKAAIRSKEMIETKKGLKGRIVTEIVPLKKFYRAEDYHQKYFERRGIDSCGI
ncbi:MAG TPA: peptide-methionine (S)-S-oxide reductase MsrA [Candidatus Methanofastidiosa archaeon]|nr:peptide-methionine (S)-S-oxide reductase MsrA [Candidatus Methanofastidiosa archaeon]HPR41115.1 peptide-methionine (S)-S-oxide reductase MsrA [Candidatus Methanofastidiosa archaeon]